MSVQSTPRNWLKSERELPWRRDWMPKFIKVLRATGKVSAARRSVADHVHSAATFYAYKHRCKAFGKAWEKALKAAKRSASKRKRAARRRTRKAS